MSADELEDSPAAPRTPYIDTESLNIGKASIVGVLFYVGVIVGAGLALASGLSLTSAIAIGLLTGGASGRSGPARFEDRRRPSDQLGTVAIEAWRTAALGARRGMTNGNARRSTSCGVTEDATCMRIWERKPQP